VHAKRIKIGPAFGDHWWAFRKFGLERRFF
jgi:hypothetical protein